MRRRGLFIMSIGFLTIMFSPKGGDTSQINTNVMWLGLLVVLIGFYFFRKDSKAAKVAQSQQEKGAADAKAKDQESESTNEQTQVSTQGDESDTQKTATKKKVTKKWNSRKH